MDLDIHIGLLVAQEGIESLKLKGGAEIKLVDVEWIVVLGKVGIEKLLLYMGSEEGRRKRYSQFWTRRRRILDRKGSNLS